MEFLKSKISKVSSVTLALMALSTLFFYQSSDNRSAVLAEETNMKTDIQESNSYLDIVDEGTCGDNAKWVFSADGTLTIYGKGDMDNYSGSSVPPWSKHINDIEVVDVREGITSIGTEAFDKCKYMVKLYMPNSMKHIAKCKYFYCQISKSMVLVDSGDTCTANHVFGGPVGQLKIINSGSEYKFVWIKTHESDYDRWDEYDWHYLY